MLGRLKTDIPLAFLKTNINLEFLIEKKIVINDITLTTESIELTKIIPLLKEANINNENLKLIRDGKLKIKNLNLKFDENFKIKNNYKVNGDIDSVNIKFSEKYEVKNLTTAFLYTKKSLFFNNTSFSLVNNKNKKSEFLNGKIDVLYKNNFQDFILKFDIKNLKDLFYIPLINYDLSKDDIQKIDANFRITKKKEIFLNKLSIFDKNNKFDIKDLILDEKFNLINFTEISVKTNLKNEINNDFTIQNN